ncbi:ATP-binding protein [Pantoea agglomerans]|uniref:ATP-binding protein n=1 Tax=Enterobacter agglomerans TaxID=549 RepID=UPI001F3433BD|nr:ATP-binding protein [Pantoea agglomerans]UJL38416.1 ATP-binding protein [Pantoea agglomerans]
MNEYFANEEAILRVGEVCEVSGRNITILVDKNKNLSDLFFKGKVLRNVSVGSFIEIKKGFMSLIGKVEAERVVEEKILAGSGSDAWRFRRYLTATLTGYVDRRGSFIGGSRELPLIGNEAFVVTEEMIQTVHQIADADETVMTFTRTDLEDIEIKLPVNGLINSHIAIFGNTGSGKSNTLAALYNAGISQVKNMLGDEFKDRCKFILFDFNGEYIGSNCITTEKKVYNLNTHHANGDKLPLPREVLLEHDMLSVLTDATDKTQKPFLKRVLDFRMRVMEVEDPLQYMRNILKKKVRQNLFSGDKPKCDAINQLFSPIFEDDPELISDLEFHSTAYKWKLRGGNIFNAEVDTERAYLYSLASNFLFKRDMIEDLLDFMYLQLIQEFLSNKSNPEHISPVINRMNANRKDIAKIFDTTGQQDFWGGNNFTVVNLNMVNITMKKTLPLLISKWAYNTKKLSTEPSTLHIIIDEAHNILSNTSFRETESWKDYRLETFEEIIKEGRKFGVFITISSQRPNDISSTIISQAHNYFIHRLINQNDLYAIEKSVSYIDRMTEESIPTLSTGTCIFSGVVSPMPLKLRVAELPSNQKPKSKTISFLDLLAKTQGDES